MNGRRPSFLNRSIVPSHPWRRTSARDLQSSPRQSRLAIKNARNPPSDKKAGLILESESYPIWSRLTTKPTRSTACRNQLEIQLLRQLHWLLSDSRKSILARAVKAKDCAHFRLVKTPGPTHANGGTFTSIQHRMADVRCAINPATNPALKPASMFTTVTFAAQLLSIPRSGARPPKLAP